LDAGSVRKLVSMRRLFTAVAAAERKRRDAHGIRATRWSVMRQNRYQN
jgi:hypothetical protein